MTQPSRTVWQFSDEPYFHPHADAWRARRGRWSGVRMTLPFAAGRVLAEFARRSRPFNEGRPIPIVLDDAGVLGARMGHTSHVRWNARDGAPGGKVLVVYVYGRARSVPYTVCHEVVHNLLYADGLTRLSHPAQATPEDVALISQISTSTSHPLAVRKLEDFDWPVIQHEAARAERFLKALARNGRPFTEPVAALIAAEFTVVLGQFWLGGARAALRRVGPYVETLAVELLPHIEACVRSIDAVEEARRRIAARLLFQVRLEGVNPLLRVPGPARS